MPRPRLLPAATVVILTLASLAAAAPSGAEARLRAAEDLIAEGRIDEARESLERLRSEGAEDPRIPFLLAQCELNAWREAPDEEGAERVRRLLAAAIRGDPEAGGPRFVAGLFAFLEKDYDAAARQYARALAAGFRPLDTRPNLALSLFEAGAVHLAKDDATEAIAAFAGAERRYRALKNDLRFLPAARAGYRDLWRKSLINLAGAHQEADNMPRAEEILRQLLDMEPDNFAHWFNLGLLYGKWHRWEEAVEAYERSLELADDPNFLAPLLHIGWIRSQQGRAEEAKAHLERFLARHPDDWYGHYYLGQHYETRGEVDLAIAEFRRCVELSPRSYAALYPLYRVLVRAGETEEAERVLAEYRRLEEAAGSRDATEGEANVERFYEVDRDGEARRETPEPVRAAIESPPAPVTEREAPPLPAPKPAPAPAVPAAAGGAPTPPPSIAGWALPLLGALLLAAAGGFLLEARRRRGA